MTSHTDRAGDEDSALILATIRLNTWFFGAILGLLSGVLLFLLAMIVAFAPWLHLGLPVVLIGVFIPGYAASWSGAFAGLAWGFAGGFLLGAGIYRIATRSALARLDELVAFERGDRDFPHAVLRLHGPSFGTGIGAMAALGLVASTSWLVIRGTAAESVHARLLAEVLPGYAVDPAGSIVGAAELFIIVYVVCQAFVFVYNAIFDARQRRT